MKRCLIQTAALPSIWVKKFNEELGMTCFVITWFGQQRLFNIVYTSQFVDWIITFFFVFVKSPVSFVESACSPVKSSVCVVQSALFFVDNLFLRTICAQAIIFLPWNIPLSQIIPYPMTDPCMYGFYMLTWLGYIDGKCDTMIMAYIRILWDTTIPDHPISHKIHVCHDHGNICHLYTPNVSIYTIHTDPMGIISRFRKVTLSFDVGSSSIDIDPIYWNVTSSRLDLKRRTNEQEPNEQPG